MPKVILKGPLVTQLNFKEAIVSGRSLFEILSKIDGNRNVILTNNYKIKPGILILVNGKDWRISKLDEIREEDIIEIIPINHGG
ncbi:MAG: hypothetical protein RRA45_07445 [Saccharolobus sp.]|jgi:hypothetical protein|uniref:hypothetical protein n=1 Tax=Saccharolobus sp. TaxID=2100761 RepID=UPI0028CED721|nr:hypothetical protein [Saccharolobus sp.]MDT7862031.1 hypothetical protein [Saccharolobus sp.]